MSDTYRNFEALSATNVEGVDYTIELQNRGTDFVIVGIHGGQIEPGTEEVVRAIAGANLSYYLFLGTDHSQHITSPHFAEPHCLDLLSRSKKAISIHGKAGDGEFVMIGGLDTDLISKAAQELQQSGFEIKPVADTVMGDETENICNRCASGKGLQIEMSRELRDALIRDPEKMRVFAQSIRNLL